MKLRTRINVKANELTKKKIKPNEKEKLEKQEKKIQEAKKELELLENPKRTITVNI